MGYPILGYPSQSFGMLAGGVTQSYSPESIGFGFQTSELHLRFLKEESTAPAKLHLSANGTGWDPKRSQEVIRKGSPKRPERGSRNGSLLAPLGGHFRAPPLDHFWAPLWGPLRVPFWLHFGSPLGSTSGPKRGPKWPPRGARGRQG